MGFEAQLLGVSIRGEKLADTIHLRLDRLVTVLYGRNGAGKTTTLERLRVLFDDESRPLTSRTIGSDWSWFDRIYATFDGDPVSLIPDPHWPYSIDATAQLITNHLPLVSARYDAHRLATELHRSRCVSFLDASVSHCNWAYQDDAAPTWAEVRAECTAATRRIYEHDREQYLEMAFFGDKDAGDAYDYELLWYVAPDLDFFGVSSPDWLPHQLKIAAVVDSVRAGARSVSFPARFDGSTADLCQHLARLVPDGLADYGEFAAWLGPLVADLGVTATRHARAFMTDSPELRCSTTPFADWLNGQMLRWEAFDPLRQDWVPVTSLSSGWSRTAAFGIANALTELPETPVPDDDDPLDHRSRIRRRLEAETPHMGLGRVLIIDEPEQALHSLAQRSVAANLANLADRVVIATHSPVFLDAFDNLHHIQRDERGLRSSELAPVTRNGLERTADELGVTATELLQLVRTIVVVEGRHDVAVLEPLLGDTLDSARARMLALDGTKAIGQLSEARWLFEFTNANVLVVLDDLIGRVRKDALTSFKETLRVRKDPKRAMRELRANVTGVGADALLLLAEAFAETGQLHRLDVFGLTRKDIVEYLPAAEFVAGATSWPALFASYHDNAQAAGEPVSGRGYKEWLRREHGAPIHLRGIAEVAERVRSGDAQLDGAAAEEIGRLRSRVALISMTATNMS